MQFMWIETSVCGDCGAIGSRISCVLSFPLRALRLREIDRLSLLAPARQQHIGGAGAAVPGRGGADGEHLALLG